MQLLSPCVTFREDQQAGWKKITHEAVVPETDDPGAARRLMTDDGFNLGILYRGHRAPYQPKPLADLDVPSRSGVRHMKSPDRPGAVPTFSTVAEFFAQALAIEIEASERYDELADQMETHNNHTIADIFRKMARIEGYCIATRSSGAPATRWSAAGPRAFMAGAGRSRGDRHARSALQDDAAPGADAGAPQRGTRHTKYFRGDRGSPEDPEIRAFAQTMAQDERHHVVLVDQWLEKSIRTIRTGRKTSIRP